MERFLATTVHQPTATYGSLRHDFITRHGYVPLTPDLSPAYGDAGGWQSGQLEPQDAIQQTCSMSKKGSQRDSCQNWRSVRPAGLICARWLCCITFCFMPLAVRQVGELSQNYTTSAKSFLPGLWWLFRYGPSLHPSIIRVAQMSSPFFHPATAVEETIDYHLPALRP